MMPSHSKDLKKLTKNIYKKIFIILNKTKKLS